MLVMMDSKRIILKFFVIGSMALANMYIDDLEDDGYEIIRHDEYFAKDYFENIRRELKITTCFISTTISIFHFDFLMNAYRSMTIERRDYFIDQLSLETENLTNPARKGTDKLILDRLVFLSHQALRYAVDNYLEILKVTDLNYKKYDIRNKPFYVKQANQFLDSIVTSPQKMTKDNCTIGILGAAGIQASWKYPFKLEGQFMKAEGVFNFAHDLKLKIDILQIPFKGSEMQLTIIISRSQMFYDEAQRLFQRAYLGKFNVQIETVYFPKIAFSVLIKDYSFDRDPATKPINVLRCLSQKLVMNFNEQGIDTTIKKKPTSEGWNSSDWKYGSTYYPPNNTCIVDSPFFFTVTYNPTNETILMGKWLPSAGAYIEETVEISDETA